ANVKPNPDLYLKIFTSAGESKTKVYKNTPVGNGLTWDLPQPQELHQGQRRKVWDQGLMKDEQLDRVTMAAWEADGQRFHVELCGQKISPPKWALPLAAAGGAMTLLVVLRFVWDQVI